MLLEKHGRNSKTGALSYQLVAEVGPAMGGCSGLKLASRRSLMGLERVMLGFWDGGGERHRRLSGAVRGRILGM